MKKAILVSLSIFLAFTTGLAQQSEPDISSEYKKGEFITTIKIASNASWQNVQKIADLFVYQYNTNLEGLFGWALKGLKLRGEQDDFITFNLKSHNYNETQNKVDGVMDIGIKLLKKDFTNTGYETTVSKHQEGNRITIRYEMLRCDNVINHVDAKFDIAKRTDNTIECIFTANVRLEKPYSLMTKKQYRENIEWRFARLLSNITSKMEEK
ncbi:hypothetical protein D0T49_00650 [Paludibacter sp. 221]|uniref:hypothetical protein n=1 Tax=Paludibacter sp. 221 TaxID=2302939 RepID=UPI0013CFD118|nr:hypothetical protein [Paludibacter sp. 221]NDV45562.1 hypothetical protein [Paludibacter sp. 221]